MNIKMTKKMKKVDQFHILRVELDGLHKEFMKAERKKVQTQLDSLDPM